MELAILLSYNNEKEYVCFGEKNRNQRYCNIQDRRQKETTKIQVGKRNSHKENRNGHTKNSFEDKQKSKTLSSIPKHNRKSTSDFLQNTVNSVSMQTDKYLSTCVSNKVFDIFSFVLWEHCVQLNGFTKENQYQMWHFKIIAPPKGIPRTKCIHLSCIL